MVSVKCYFCRYSMPLKIIRQGEEFNEPRPVVVTTGTFDGVHLGHGKILGRLRERALQYGGVSVVISFDPHPRRVLFPDAEPVALLSSLREKQHLLEGQGVDYLYLIPFTKDFSKRSSREFIEQDIVASLHPVCLVTGYDHQFGKDRQGNIKDLVIYGQEFGFAVEEIPAMDIDQVAISSSIIRKSLLSGEIAIANKYLGYSYSLRGLVEDGEKLGRLLGFPTANLKIEDDFKLIPADGVYACMAETSAGTFPCMVNIGYRPTFGGRQRKIEAHLLGFSGDLYGQELNLKFHQKIRDEKKFSGKEELIFQLESDRLTAREILEI